MTDKKTFRILYCPHSGNPVFKRVSKLQQYEEYLALSEDLFLLYNLGKQTPNASLTIYGGILSDIPGDAVLFMENETGMIDVPEDLISRLPEILEADRKQREEFYKTLVSKGFNVLI